MKYQPASFDYVEKNYENWKKLSAKLPIIKDTDPKILGYDGRDYQITCCNKFRGKNQTLLIAPTGSGKSIMQVFNAAMEILDTNYKKGQVFVVPQLNIGNGFTEKKHKKLLIDGVVYNWEVTVNCCDNNEKSVSNTIDFLLYDNPCKSFKADKTIGGVTAVVSHQAMVAAFKKMTNKQQLLAVKRNAFRFDEIHHAEGVIKGDLDLANQLGRVIKFILDHDGSIHPTTATFFRGNNNLIFDKEYLDQFEIFHVPFLEHWKNLRLKRLHQDFPCYSDAGNLLDQILTSVANEPNEPALIIIPSDGVKFFKDTDKWAWVDRLLQGLGKIPWIGGKDKILDLITSANQAKDKKRLIDEAGDFNCVVTCMIGREGADWPACSRIHNTILDANVLQPIQKMGRALRYYFDKDDVKMYTYIEQFPEWDSEDEEVREDIRERISDRFNAIMLTSMQEDMFFPYLMPTLPQEKDDSNEATDVVEEPKMITIEELFGNKRAELMNELLERVMRTPLEDRSAEVYSAIVEDLIQEYKEFALCEVADDVLRYRMLTEIARMFNPNSPKLRLLPVDFIRTSGWDKVFRENVKNGSPFVANVGTEDLKDLHKLQKFLQTSWDENFNKVAEIGIKKIDPKTALGKWAAIQKRHWRVQSSVLDID